VAELKLFKGGAAGKWWGKQTAMTHAAIMLGVPAAGALAVLHRKSAAAPAKTAADPNAALPDLSGGYQPGPPVSGYPGNINVTVQMPAAAKTTTTKAKAKPKHPAHPAHPTHPTHPTKKPKAKPKPLPVAAANRRAIAAHHVVHAAPSNLGAHTRGPVIVHTPPRTAPSQGTHLTYQTIRNERMR
jgi:hypothetical protein